MKKTTIGLSIASVLLSIGGFFIDMISNKVDDKINDERMKEIANEVYDQKNKEES